MNSAPPTRPVSGRRKLLRVLIVLLLIALGAVALYYELPSHLQRAMKAAVEWLDDLHKQHGLRASIVFIALYIASCVAMLPASILTIGAGAAFGVLKGAILVSIGATLGAAAAFLVSRHVARDWVTRKFGHRPSFTAIDRAVAEEGWKIVFLTRLAPIFPFFILNYVYGLTRVKFWHYVLATWIGIIPGSTLFVFIGYTLRQAGSQNSTLTDWLKYGFILITAVIATVYLGKVARRALARHVEPPAAPAVES